MRFELTASKVKLRYRLQKRQIHMINRFAQMMKWPNLSETVDRMKEMKANGTLDVSSDAMAFFSGLILPGVRSAAPTLCSEGRLC